MLLKHHLPNLDFYSYTSLNKLNYAFPQRPLCLLSKILLNHGISEIRMKKCEEVETEYFYILFSKETLVFVLHNLVVLNCVAKLLFKHLLGHMWKICAFYINSL